MQLMIDIFCFLCYDLLEVIILALQEIRQYHDDFEVWHSAYVNMTFLAHQHTEVELIWVRKGSSVLTVNNQTFSLKEGDLLLCQSGSIHYSEKQAKNVLEFILFNPSLIQSKRVPLSLSTQHFKAKKLAKYGMDKSIEKIFTDISNELTLHEPFYQNVVQNTLKTFLYRLQRYFPVTSTDDTATSQKSSPFISEALNYMEANISEELSLEQIAKVLNIDSGYFSRIFKKYTGLNFVQYRNSLRLDNAIKLLQETDKSISDIAFDCGFQNIRTFNRVFIQYTSKSPMEFRRDVDLVCPINIHPHQKNSDYILVTNDSPVVKIHK